MARGKLLIAATSVGILAGFLFYLYGKQLEEEKDQITADPHEVVVAAEAISAGALLQRDQVTTRSVPAQFLPANPLLAADLHIYLGQTVAESMGQGDMILTSDFAVAEVAPTLAGRIPPGERAMTIPVDAISGVAGLLRPGDGVDILATFPVGEQDELIPEAAGGESMGYVTMSLLQNVTLLAVGDKISGLNQVEERGRAGYGHVTVSLTPDEAELLLIAQTRGELSLLLRHRDDLETISVTRRTLREVLEELDVLNQVREERVVKRPRPCPPGQRRGEGGQCIREIEEIR